MDAVLQPPEQRRSKAPSTVKVDLLLRAFFPLLHDPRTDILDLTAVAIGERRVGVLFMRREALAEPVFRELVALGRACGCFISDLNGHIGLAAEYCSTVHHATTVPVWLVCKSQALLWEMIEAHQELQPQGFTRWAQYLGLKLGYPKCCVDTYIEAVRCPEHREDFWRKRMTESLSTKHLMIGFAPCPDYCKGYQREMIRHLIMARRIGILHAQRTKLWLEAIGQSSELHRILTTPVLVDMGAVFSLRVPTS